MSDTSLLETPSPGTALPVLYHAPVSSASFRVRMALFVKQVRYESVVLDMAAGEHKQPSYLALNPQGAVPTLVTPGGRPISQSMAIVQWLDDHYPGMILLPRTDTLKYAATAFCDLIACEIHPLQGSRLSKWLQEAGVPAEVFPGIAHRAMNEGFTAAQALCARFDGLFALGPAFTAADIWLIAQLRNARRYELDLSPFTRLTEVEQACRDAFPGIAQA